MKNVKKRLFIICEGEKTEPNYIHEFLEELNFRGHPVEIKITPTQHTQPIKLINLGIKTREIPKDEVWVVYDKNGYTKHREAFKKAKKNNIKIAFSSISFETWILLHFRYTTRAFLNSQRLISYLQQYLPKYKKNSKNIYNQIKNLTEEAKNRSIQLRNHHNKVNSRKKNYNLNPYTNFDSLIEAIHKIHKEYQ